MPKSSPETDPYQALEKAQTLGEALPLYWDAFARTDSAFNPELRPDLKPVPNNLGQILHGTLGMISEMGELQAAIENNNRVNYLEEIGDFIWFLSLTCKGLDDVLEQYVARWGRNLSWVGVEDVAGFEVREVLDTLADRVKALIYYNSTELKPLSLDRQVGFAFGHSKDPGQVLDQILDELLARWLCWIGPKQLNEGLGLYTLIPRCMKQNIRKLVARHGKGPAQTDHRDYQAEARAVEGS